jgi:hypothetical protein
MECHARDMLPSEFSDETVAFSIRQVCIYLSLVSYDLVKILGKKIARQLVTRFVSVAQRNRHLLFVHIGHGLVDCLLLGSYWVSFFFGLFGFLVHVALLHESVLKASLGQILEERPVRLFLASHTVSAEVENAASSQSHRGNGGSSSSLPCPYPLLSAHFRSLLPYSFFLTSCIKSRRLLTILQT